MIDKTKVTQAVKEMTKNQDWRDVLEKAPGAANLRIGLAFYASKNLDAMSQQEKDEYREFREMLEAQLNEEELQYLTDAFGRMGVQAAESHYRELLEKKKQQGVGTGGTGVTGGEGSVGVGAGQPASTGATEQQSAGAVAGQG